MKRHYLALAILSVFLVSKPATAADRSADTPRVGSEEPGAGLVSMYALIARPKDFDGKAISIVGVLVLLDRAAAIYPNSDSRRFGWKREAVYLPLSEDQQRKAAQLTNQFVSVSGVFSYSGDDVSGSYLGMLTKVTTIYGRPDRSGSE